MMAEPTTNKTQLSNASNVVTPLQVRGAKLVAFRQWRNGA